MDPVHNIYRTIASNAIRTPRNEQYRFVAIGIQT